MWPAKRIYCPVLCRECLLMPALNQGSICRRVRQCLANISPNSFGQVLSYETVDTIREPPRPKSQRPERHTQPYQLLDSSHNLSASGDSHQSSGRTVAWDLLQEVKVLATVKAQPQSECTVTLITNQ